MKIVQLMILVFIVLAVVFVVLRKIGDEPPGSVELSKAVSSASVFFLSTVELENLSREALNGNGDAAFRIYQYFALSNYNYEKQIYWLEIALKNGHPQAQQHLAHYRAQEALRGPGQPDNFSAAQTTNKLIK